MNGFLVALWLSPETAAAIAVPGGEEPESLHVTLCYCGDLSVLSELQIASAIVAVSGVARSHGPLTGQIGGTGRFFASETSDNRDAFYASVDVPDLGSVREHLAEVLQQAGCPASDAHGFTPHITLAYVDPGADLPADGGVGAPRAAPLSLRFDTLTIMRGDKRVDLPFSGGVLSEMRPESYTELADLCAQSDGRDVRLFNELTAFAEPPDWIPVLPKPGIYNSPRYGEIRITADRNANFVHQFDRGVYQTQVPVDAEHQLEASGAVGWIQKLRQNQDQSVDARVEWTDRGIALIEADRFKYVSPSWFDAWTDPATGEKHQDVLIGAALTTRPFFKEGALRPLVASERGLFELDNAEGDTVMTDQAIVATATNDESRQMTERIAALEAERDAARQAAEAQSDALRQATERIQSMERLSRRKRFTDEVTGRGDASDLRWFGEVETQVGILETLSETFGEDAPQFTAYVTQQRAVAEQLRQSRLFDEIGRDATGDGDASAIGKLERIAIKLREGDPSLSMAVAIDRAVTENPRLYSEHLAEKGGR